MEGNGFWSFDFQIGEGNFREEVMIRLKAHVSEESYESSTAKSEIVPISSKRGCKIYVLAKPCILEPEMSIEVGLYPNPKENRVIGKVISFRWEGMGEREIGHAQAWYYLEDNILILWECYLYGWFRKENPSEDGNLKLFWKGFERFLKGRFPNADRIFTTSWEPIYEISLWQNFLRSLGYRRFNKRAFVKEVISKGEQHGSSKKRRPYRDLKLEGR